jgi:hypothetical protein
MRLALVLLAFLVASRASAQGSGTIAGRVLEEDGVTAVIGATVRVDSTMLRVTADVDGNYRIIGVPVGTYSVTASYTGYPSESQADVEVNAGHTRQLDFTLSPGPNIECFVSYDDSSLFWDMGAYPARVLIEDDLERMPVNR